MNPKMAKLMALKKDKGMSDVEKDAKKNALGELSSIAKKAMGEKLGGIKKVEVASDSKEGLEAGLDMAKEKLEDKSEEKTEGDSQMMEMLEEKGHSCSMDELEQLKVKIDELIAQKKSNEIGV